MRFVSSPLDLATLDGIMSQFEGWFSPDGFWWPCGGPFARAPSGRWALVFTVVVLWFLLQSDGVWSLETGAAALDGGSLPGCRASQRL
jgi:hypothetical protein